MGRLGDSNQHELIAQLEAVLRDSLPRRPALAVVERVYLSSVTVRLKVGGTRYKGIPVIDGVRGLQEGSDIYLLFLDSQTVVGLKMVS
jgi:hypothetical protein